MKIGQSITWKTLTGSECSGIVIDIDDKNGVFTYQINGGKTIIQDYTSEDKKESTKGTTREIESVQTATCPINIADKMFTFI